MERWCRILIVNHVQFLIMKETYESELENFGFCVSIYFYHNKEKYFHRLPAVNEEIQHDIFMQITGDQLRDMYNENAANLN